MRKCQRGDGTRMISDRLKGKRPFVCPEVDTGCRDQTWPVQQELPRARRAVGARRGSKRRRQFCRFNNVRP
jgi:hypothetical protein